MGAPATGRCRSRNLRWPGHTRPAPCGRFPVAGSTSSAAAGDAGPRSVRRSPSGIRPRRPDGSRRLPGDSARERSAARIVSAHLRGFFGHLGIAELAPVACTVEPERLGCPEAGGSLPPRRAGREPDPMSADRPWRGAPWPRPAGASARDDPPRAAGVPPGPASSNPDARRRAAHPGAGRVPASARKRRSPDAGGPRAQAWCLQGTGRATCRSRGPVSARSA